jgi:hypothetical protein
VLRGGSASVDQEDDTDDEEIKRGIDPRRQTEEILDQIQDLLREGDLVSCRLSMPSNGMCVHHCLCLCDARRESERKRGKREMRVKVRVRERGSEGGSERKGTREGEEGRKKERATARARQASGLSERERD